MGSLVATAVFVAAVGLVQQLVGEWALYDLGYSFRVQLRTVDGHLRSFGTLDEPFAYAAFLLLALAALVMWFRLSVLTVAAGSVIMAGLFFSFVRTALVVGLALVALLLARKGYTATSIFLLAVAAVSALVLLFASSTATETRTVRTGTSNFLTVNGRTEAWRLFLNDPKVWFLGHGVGKVGTAAERATYEVTQDPDEASRQVAIDSGYFAAIADVGLLGLAAMLAVFGRLIFLARRFAARGSRAGWLALGLMAVLMIDAVTRASFTGFPTAFLALLLAGLAVGAAIEGDPELRLGRRHAGRVAERTTLHRARRADRRRPLRHPPLCESGHAGAGRGRAPTSRSSGSRSSRRATAPRPSARGESPCACSPCAARASTPARAGSPQSRLVAATSRSRPPSLLRPDGPAPRAVAPFRGDRARRLERSRPRAAPARLQAPRLALGSPARTSPRRGLAIRRRRDGAALRRTDWTGSRSSTPAPASPTSRRPSATEPLPPSGRTSSTSATWPDARTCRS